MKGDEKQNPEFRIQNKRPKPEIRSRKIKRTESATVVSALYSGFWILTPEFCFSSSFINFAHGTEKYIGC
jgi:hypothetical protein